MKKNRPFYIPLALLFLVFGASGCMETEFQFKTEVRRDGSVARKMKIEGRGANLFKAPQGGGWKSQVTQTHGSQTLLPDVVHHIQAEGVFAPGEIIAPDYEFDLSKRTAEWSEEEKKRLERAGIKPPYRENLFSRNQIKVHQVQGWFTETTFYEEVFQNAGVIPLLMMDLKEEVKKQAEGRGEEFSERELEDLARLRLEEEILPEIRFRGEVEMPGKIISTNGRQSGARNASWKFTMRNFQAGYSIYTLRAASRTFRPAAMLFFGGIALLLAVLFVITAVGMSLFKNKTFEDKPVKRKPRRKRGGEETPQA